VDTGSFTIPKGFMGMSHEWPHVEEIYDVPEYKEVIRLLNSYGGGPHIMRVGGGSTDLLTTVPGNEVWGPLTALYRETGTRYILGLNFEKGDIDLAKRQMDAAIRGLPADAIVSFEIGNEVRCSRLMVHNCRSMRPQQAVCICVCMMWLGVASVCCRSRLVVWSASPCMCHPPNDGFITHTAVTSSQQPSRKGINSGRPLILSYQEAYT
jgi:hypothetical protein